MATSSSDESAPREFTLSSSTDNKYFVNCKKCPLCSTSSRKFFCRDCIHRGSYGFPESFATKRLRLKNLFEDNTDLALKCMNILNAQRDIDVLESGIKQTENNIRLIKDAIDYHKARKKDNDEALDELKTNNIKMEEKLPKYGKHVDKLADYVSEKSRKNEIKRNEDLQKQREFSKFTRTRINELMEYIFPISKLNARSLEMDSSENEMVSALAEASRTTYIQDRWVYTDNSGELQHIIVAPALPGSGNYSDYNLWVTQNKDGVPGSSSTSSIEHNPAYGISAALTYTAQLVNIISFFLDVRLPHKMNYSDFCSSSMSEQQFTRRVARLNANVLHLCFTQNVDITKLHPTQTLPNILQLVDPGNEKLGRQGPMEIENDVMIESFNTNLSNDLFINEDSDSEEGDALPNEWEAVPHAPCPEFNTTAMGSLQSTQNITSQQASSVAGGLVNSAAAFVSILRGWTNR